MTLIKRLEAAAKEFDRRVWPKNAGYSQQDADTRELLEQAAQEIRTQLYVVLLTGEKIPFANFGKFR